MRMLMMGPQGVGKGTQAKMLAARCAIPHISTGDVFRANVSAGTELGKQIESLINAGELVPDALTDRIVADRLAQPDCANGWILDGYPRTIEQVRALDAVLEQSDQRIDVVLELRADYDELIKRIHERAQIEGRADDNPEAVAKRLQTYDKETAPLLDIYRDRGFVVAVDSEDVIEDTQASIVKHLQQCGLPGVKI
ncbi:adenylate kinase [Bifidobacterium oedipodis]|uniref:Adenylate kinase n=1 Tax=Bifidobacterium oedipodis TaxID=2675322 RepID=A0A7Y0HTF0_9BIFI|nr:adenylate kinase [Bifidobacterium sp. DSM 109957]NMM94518.1 adenylate kinase [Bifidobacterium sp. DSM 109957]